MLSKFIINETAVREYVTVAIPDDKIRERVFLQLGDRFLDISENHWPLCLDPVIFGIWIPVTENIDVLCSLTVCKMHFADSTNDVRNAESHLVAVLILDLVDKIEEEDGILLLLRSVKGRIHHLEFAKILFLYFRYYKKPQLPFSKFKFLVAAFSYPRKVRVISFGREADDYNIFPMDFAGYIGPFGRLVLGLRHTNRSVSKIIESKKLIVSESSSTYKSIIYTLGKNHLSHLPPPDTLPFKIIKTEQLGFWVPEWVDSYREISIDKTMNLGSHVLFWGKVVNEKNFNATDGHLYHIHFLLNLYHKRKDFAYSPAL